MNIESIVLVSLLDLAILSVVVLAGYRLARIRTAHKQRYGDARPGGYRYIFAGLILTTVFYVVDLFTMSVLPSLVGDEAAHTAIEALHSSHLGVVSLLAVGLIAYGLVISARTNAQLFEQLSDSQRDVAQELERQKAMSMANKALFDAIEAAPLGIAVYDADGALNVCNSAYARLELEPLGLGAGGTKHLTEVSEARQRLTEQGRLFQKVVEETDQLTVSEDDYGGSRWCRRHASRTKDGTTLVAVADITQRQQMARALVESERRYLSIFTFASQPMYLSDGEHILEANPAAAKLYEYDSPEDMRGLDVIELIHPDDRPRFRERLKDMANLRQPLPFVEDRRISRTGKELIVQQSGTPIELGGTFAILAVNHDLTALKEQEAALLQAQKMEAIGQLTGGVAHDFNNLLSVILVNAELLRSRIKPESVPDDAPARYVGSIIDAVGRGADLTSRLLAYARRQPLAPEPVDMNALISENADLFQRALGESISVVTIRGAGLWRVMADRNQLTTALLNLALNARDAMPQGGKLTIELSNTEISPSYAALAGEVTAGRYVVLAVTDTGEGIEETNLKRVFDPFFTTKEPDEGTGLGLSMVYGYVKQSGGHITIYSEPGSGTTVRLYLPKADDGTLEQRAPASANVVDSLPGVRLLLVEDDESLRDVITAMLEEMQVEVRMARDAKSALALLADNPELDILLTDVVLPGGQNGRQLADRICATHPGVSVLYMSGYTENAILHDGMLDEGVHLLSKPFDRQQLTDALHRALDSNATQDGSNDS